MSLQRVAFHIKFYKICNELIFNMLPTPLQKVAFWLAICRLLQAERPCFAAQKATFCLALDGSTGSDRTDGDDTMADDRPPDDRRPPCLTPLVPGLFLGVVVVHDVPCLLPLPLVGHESLAVPAVLVGGMQARRTAEVEQYPGRHAA